MPWSHFAVAYVPYALYRLHRDGHTPGRGAFLVLLFATLLPDLVDKPLAWTFGVLPSGRLLAHSLVVAVPFGLLLVALARAAGYGHLGALIAFGHLSHVVADSSPLLWRGAGYYYLPNLFWPLVPANPDLESGFLVHFERVAVTPGLLLALGLFVLAWAFAQPEIRRAWFAAPE